MGYFPISKIQDFLHGAGVVSCAISKDRNGERRCHTVSQEVLAALSILGLFVVRVGAPIAITIAVGIWLEKRLQPQAYAEQAARTQARLEAIRAAQVPAHCWEIKACDPTKSRGCPAFLRQDLPCWLALQVAGLKIERCAGCDLYRHQPVPA